MMKNGKLTAEGLIIGTHVFPTPSAARAWIADAGYHSYVDGKEEAWLSRDDPREHRYRSMGLLVCALLSIFCLASMQPLAALVTSVIPLSLLGMKELQYYYWFGHHNVTGDVAPLAGAAIPLLAFERSAGVPSSAIHMQMRGN